MGGPYVFFEKEKSFSNPDLEDDQRIFYDLREVLRSPYRLYSLRHLMGCPDLLSLICLERRNPPSAGGDPRIEINARLIFFNSESGSGLPYLGLAFLRRV